MDLKEMMKLLSLGLALAIAAPAVAGDASDTVTEKKADTKKAVRNAKPGDKTAGDRVDDATDTAKSGAAKARKGARHTGRDIKHGVHDATK